MAERVARRRRDLAVALTMTIPVLGLVGCAHTASGGRGPENVTAPARVFPWEWWRDPSLIAVVGSGDRIITRTSHCPSGCDQDRHSSDDSRFLRLTETGEGVIFSAAGAGAVTRIWMVMGDNVSGALDPSIRLRVRIDGRRRPVVDFALPELFGGASPPFVPPLVADRTVSGGGNVSYVPIPFRDGCEITLVGAERAKIWFQVTARLVADGGGLRSFTGKESMAGFRSALEREAGDPWRGGPFPTTGGSVVLSPGGGETIATFDGPDVVNGIIIRTSREHWKRLGLRLTFDDREPMLVPLFDLFGIARTNEWAARSILFGADDDDDLYCYFPMPFFDVATIELLRRPVEGPPQVAVEYAVRRLGTPPPDWAGYFGIQVLDNRKDPDAREMPIVELQGRGSWVGLFASFGPALGNKYTFLEGDEEVFVDGGNEPAWHGTGIEDFFGGGFYFRDAQGEPQPFVLPLHGVPAVRFFHRAAPAAYRLLLGDAVVFEESLRAGFERFPAEAPSPGMRSVVFFYSSPRPAGAESPSPSR